MTLGHWWREAELERRGPIVRVFIADLDAVGGTEIRGAEAPMLVDTGSDVTLLGESHCGLLGVPVRERDVLGVSGVPEAVATYMAMIGFVLQATRGAPERFVIWWAGEVLAMPIQPHDFGYLGVLGRDVLSRFRFEYDGSDGECSLELMRDEPPGILVPEQARRAVERHAKRGARKRR